MNKRKYVSGILVTNLYDLKQSSLHFLKLYGILFLLSLLLSQHQCFLSLLLTLALDIFAIFQSFVCFSLAFSLFRLFNG